MTTNIGQLYQLQKELDTHIVTEKKLQGQDLLPNLVLALQVEIGYLANLWRGFKHWSNDQNPRVSGMHGDVPYNPLLEKYADCLHFFLSIANQMGLPEDDLYTEDDSLEDGTARAFTELLFHVSLIEIKEGHDAKLTNFRVAMYIFANLAYDLGFEWEQIVEAYMAKNAVNHERQASGY